MLKKSVVNLILLDLVRRRLKNLCQSCNLILHSPDSYRERDKGRGFPVITLKPE